MPSDGGRRARSAAPRPGMVPPRDSPVRQYATLTSGSERIRADNTLKERLRKIPATQQFLGLLRECPRQESNLCTRFRKPLLYPLSYGGRLRTIAPADAIGSAREARR